MSIKLVVSDMDGTLLGFTDDLYYQISKEAVEAVNSLKDKNINFVVATGRHYKDAHNILKEAKIEMLKPSFVIGMNGAQVYSIDEEKLLIDEYIEDKYKETIKNIYEAILKDEPKNVIMILYCEDDIAQIIRQDNSNYNKSVEKMLRFENNDNTIKYEEIDNILDSKKIYKACFHYTIDIDDGTEKIDIMNSISRDLTYLLTGDSFIEILPKNVNKGSAVKFIKDRYKVARDELIVIGDSGNDLAMFLQSEHSATRKTAKKFVIDAASKSFEGGASFFVAHAIKHYIK